MAWHILGGLFSTGLLDRPSFPLCCGDTFSSGSTQGRPLRLCSLGLCRLRALLELGISGTLSLGHLFSNGGAALESRFLAPGRGWQCADTAVQHSTDLRNLIVESLFLDLEAFDGGG